MIFSLKAQVLRKSAIIGLTVLVHPQEKEVPHRRHEDFPLESFSAKGTTTCPLQSVSFPWIGVGVFAVTGLCLCPVMPECI